MFDIKQDIFNLEDGSQIPICYRSDSNDWNTAASILRDDEYQLFQLVKQVEQRGTCVDIGAHLGAASVLMSHLGFPVVAIDIVSENIDLIALNAELNNIEIITNWKAIAGTSDQVVNAFYQHDKSHFCREHKFVGTTIPGEIFNAGPSFDIKTISIEDLFIQFNIEYCPILKIDCEGAEWDAFENISSEVLDKIHFIVGELHLEARENSTSEDFLDLFKGKFKDVSSRYKDMAMPVNTKAGNFILERVQEQP